MRRGTKTAVAREMVAAPDFPYATLTFKKTNVAFRVVEGKDNKGVKTGSEPYGKNVKKAIDTVFKLLKDSGVDPSNVEVIA